MVTYAWEPYSRPSRGALTLGRHHDQGGLSLVALTGHSGTPPLKHFECGAWVGYQGRQLAGPTMMSAVTKMLTVLSLLLCPFVTVSQTGACEVWQDNHKFHLIVSALSDYVRTAQAIETNINAISDSLGLLLAGQGGTTDGAWQYPVGFDNGAGANTQTVQVDAPTIVQFLPAAVPLMSDCWLSTAEISTLPSVVEFINLQVIPSMAAGMGVGVETIAINGLSSAGGTAPGCSGAAPPSSG